MKWLIYIIIGLAIGVSLVNCAEDRNIENQQKLQNCIKNFTDKGWTAEANIEAWCRNE